MILDIEKAEEIVKDAMTELARGAHVPSQIFLAAAFYRTSFHKLRKEFGKKKPCPDLSISNAPSAASTSGRYSKEAYCEREWFTFASSARPKGKRWR